ncbi:hypothetical protein BURCENK562V_C6362 [Burkholderia cenocepacia K56-2Valvano]|nr:hypothetical protein BURCENK562V_C6362 [Burkholderia cenocepacia K56-2Valvano]
MVECQGAGWHERRSGSESVMVGGRRAGRRRTGRRTRPRSGPAGAAPGAAGPQRRPHDRHSGQL